MDISSLIDLCQKQVEVKTFPGAAFALGNSKETAFGYLGNFTYKSDSPKVSPESIYDLASLTKVMATTAAAMLLFDDEKLDLERPVAEYLPAFAGADKGKVTVRNLLLHDSGLPAYANLSKSKAPEEARGAVLALKLEAKPGAKTVYSCMSMITLLQVVEKILGDFPPPTPSSFSAGAKNKEGAMDTFLKSRLWEPLGMKDTSYNPSEEVKARCVPTVEKDEKRRREIKGEVHDPAAFYCGGLSGNAGLFSTASDVARFARLMLDKGAAGSQQIICASTIETWTKKQSDKSTRALGWDTKSPEGSSAGTKFSIKSFGHTGYTGTSLWIDPENQFFAVLLTNRVYPDDKNAAHNTFRPKFHDAAFDVLKTS